MMLAAALPQPAAGEPPELVEVPAGEHGLTLYSEKLSVTPHPDQQMVYLLFSGGVTVVGEDFKMSADLVEMGVDNSEALEGMERVLPSSSKDIEYLVREPSQALAEMETGLEEMKSRLAEMESELMLPEGRLPQSSLRRVGARGNVIVEAKGVELTTSELISNDGGITWATTGRSQLSYTYGQESRAKLSADYARLKQLSTTERVAQAYGNVSGSIEDQRIKNPVEFEAQNCVIDIRDVHKVKLTISEGLSVRSGNLELCCGLLTADLSAGDDEGRPTVLEAAGSPQVKYGESDLMLTADKISIEIPANKKKTSRRGTGQSSFAAVIEASGGVQAAVDHDLLAKTSGIKSPGEDKPQAEDESAEQLWSVIIEVDGPTKARLNLDELQPDDSYDSDQAPIPVLELGAQLIADELRAEVELRDEVLEGTLTATGEPQLTYGNSSYVGQTITVSWQQLAGEETE